MELQGQGLENFQRAWNRCVRNLLKLSYETHRRYLPSLVVTSSAKHQIYTKVVKLVPKMETVGMPELAFWPSNAETYQDQ